MLKKIERLVVESTELLKNELTYLGDKMIDLNKELELKGIAFSIFREVNTLFLQYKQLNDLIERNSVILKKLDGIRYVDVADQINECRKFQEKCSFDMKLIEEKIIALLHPFYGDILYQFGNVDKMDNFHKENSIFIAKLYLGYGMKDIEDRIAYAYCEISNKESDLSKYNVIFMNRFWWVLILICIPLFSIYLDFWLVGNIILILILTFLLFSLYKFYRRKLECNLENLKLRLSKDKNDIDSLWNEIKKSSRERFD